MPPSRPSARPGVGRDAGRSGRRGRLQRNWITPYQLGRRALTVSLSDLAATGSEPASCLLRICPHPSTAALDVLGIDAGLCDAAVESACSVVGGDVSAIDGPLVVDVTAGGFVERNRVLRHDAGRPGDLLLVTGTLGRAAGGLAVLQGRLSAESAHSSWVAAQISPALGSRRGGRWLRATCGARRPQ